MYVCMYVYIYIFIYILCMSCPGPLQANLGSLADESTLMCLLPLVAYQFTDGHPIVIAVIIVTTIIIVIVITSSPTAIQRVSWRVACPTREEDTCNFGVSTQAGLYFYGADFLQTTGKTHLIYSNSLTWGSCRVVSDYAKRPRTPESRGSDLASQSKFRGRVSPRHISLSLYLSLSIYIYIYI